MTTRHSACRRADARQGRGNGGGRHRRRLGETRGRGRGAVEVARAQATTESSYGPTSWVRLLTAVEERPPLQGGHGEERNDCRIMVEVKKHPGWACSNDRERFTRPATCIIATGTTGPKERRNRKKKRMTGWPFVKEPRQLGQAGDCGGGTAFPGSTDTLFRAAMVKKSGRTMVEVKKYKKGGAASRWRANPSCLVLAGPDSTTKKSSPYAPAVHKSSATRARGLCNHSVPQGGSLPRVIC